MPVNRNECTERRVWKALALSLALCASPYAYDNFQKFDFQETAAAIKDFIKNIPAPEKEGGKDAEANGPSVASDRTTPGIGDDEIHTVYAPDKMRELRDMYLPANIPDGTEKKLDIQFNNVGRDIVQTIPLSSSGLVNRVHDDGRPTLILCGDSEHHSIGVKREFAHLIQETSPTHVFTEDHDKDQKQYDDFADAVRSGTSIEKIQKFRQRVESIDGYAPAGNLRSAFFDAGYSVYEVAARNGVDLKFVDVAGLDGARVNAYNRALKFEHSFVVLKHLMENHSLDFDDLMNPVRQQLANIIVFSIKDNDREVLVPGAETVVRSLRELRDDTELTKTRVLNIMKQAFESELYQHRHFPLGWPNGDIDFTTQLNFGDLKNRAEQILPKLKQATRDLEKIRDEKRNPHMVQNIVDEYKACKDKQDFRGMALIGKAHYVGNNNMVEQLKRALPGVRIIRADITPVSDHDVKKMGSQVAYGDFEGTDCFIFTPCPTVDLVSEIIPKP